MISTQRGIWLYDYYKQLCKHRKSVTKINEVIKCNKRDTYTITKIPQETEKSAIWDEKNPAGPNDINNTVTYTWSEIER